MFLYSVPVGMSLSDVRPQLRRTTTAFASPLLLFFFVSKEILLG